MQTCGERERMRMRMRYGYTVRKKAAAEHNSRT